jgi:hypothetical protein
LLIIAAAAAAGANPTATPAGTIRHDVPDAQYTTLAADPKYAPVGRLSWNTSAGAFAGSGTLLSSTWLLTAAHCVDDATLSNLKFQVNGQTYTAEEWLPHSSWTGDLKRGYDIALVRLSAPVTNVVPAARFTGLTEVGLVGTSVGFGRSGTGLTGDTIASGTKRAGQNLLDALGSQLVTTGSQANRYSDRIVLGDFDHPTDSSYNRTFSASGAALPLEYMIAGGDSGGGLFVDVAGHARLAAVHSFTQALDTTTNSSYGDAFGSTRMNQFNEWVDDNVSNQWTNPNGGSFTAGPNWSAAAAPTATDIVAFRTPGTYTVTLAASATSDRILARGGQVTLNLGGHSYALTSRSAEGSLTVGKYAGNNAAVAFANGTASTRHAVIAAMAGSTGNATVGTGGTWNVDGNVYVGGSETGAGGTGTLTVSAGGSLRVIGTLQTWGAGTVRFDGGSLHADHLSLNSGGKLLAAAGGDKVLRAGSLNIDSASTIDLANNDFVIDYSGASPADAVLQYLSNGYAGGAWNGNGITSSAAATDQNAATAIGWAENATLGLGDYLGLPLDASALILKYTWYGDANLDGLLSVDDFSLLDRGFTAGLTGWVNGDFNYDDVVSSADYLLLDAAYSLQSGTLSPALLSERAAQFGDGYVARLAAVVPEPAMLGFAALAMAAAGMRRARQSRPNRAGTPR